MNRVTQHLLRFNTPSITSSRNVSTRQNNDTFPYKLCQVKSKAYSPGKVLAPSRYIKSLRNSSVIISSVCKGLVFYPRAMSLNPLSKLKNLATLLSEPDKADHQSEKDHQKTLAEQQKQLERLKKDPGRLEREEEKFPKYKPK